MKRKEGYYWVRTKHNKWAIGYWREKCVYWSIGSIDELKDDDFLEIGPAIEEPAAHAAEPTYTITVRDVYSKPLPELLPLLPKGKRVAGFRPPKAGEKFLSEFTGSSDTLCVVASIDHPSYHPRLILEDIPARKRWVLEETGEEARKLSPGEYYINVNGNLVRYDNPLVWGEWRPIRLVRVEMIEE